MGGGEVWKSQVSGNLCLDLIRVSYLQAEG